MLSLNKVHHVAIICSDYERSKTFYTEILGFQILNEVFRKERESYKLDLALGSNYIIELFSFPNTPNRPTKPEATGLRHLAFEVDNLILEKAKLEKLKVDHEKVRRDEITGKDFLFFFDPDGLPIELYQK
ncbi:glyoxylase I family protein [Gillisia sp. Hel1_33_143]|uniref:SMU1112c/YaeR family gloxylase I-like metalloprotein n=1 Tax=Gillisia sp. Hel1_33_143 TaxID=1336796 RepID=UPI00087BFE7F|nr:VOC family protein [Gillisia sp. Hel1_33_143]SDS71115.1 glyoxylase I family protein [Gillisia sp. Hel1_33_143]